jgi:hypothetical protein
MCGTLKGGSMCVCIRVCVSMWGGGIGMLGYVVAILMVGGAPWMY